MRKEMMFAMVFLMLLRMSVQCHSTCQGCLFGNQAADYCTNCNDQRYIVYVHYSLINSGTCNCRVNTTDNSGSCPPCQSKCLSCLYLASNCTVCNGSYRDSAPSCNCITGYVENSSGECVPACQVSCLTCVTSFNNKCATCDSSTNRVYNATNQQCECPSGYADNGVTAACITCSYTCTTCSISATNCTSCPATRTLNAGSNTCPCNTKLYDASNATCLSCMVTCKTCTTGTTCSSCNATAFRSLSGSQCACMAGYFDNGQDQVCAACDYRCATCSSLSICNTCESSNMRANPASNCTCNAPYYDNGVPLCALCHYTCATCSNGSQCLTCSSATFRSLNNATKLCTCMSGYYDPGYDSNSATPQACLPCMAGCAVCTTSSNCQQCTNTSHYVNSTTFVCTPCFSTCLTCSGPASNNCLSCASPKYLVANMCTSVVCPFGKYVNILDGCSACSDLYQNSLSCTIDEPLSCTTVTMLSEQECKACDQVTGYALSDGVCKEICGDGYLIGYQCDDGNTLDGDGCSSSCNIETGWACNVVSNRSSCTLTAAVELSLVGIIKFPRKNKIRITLKNSLPLRLSSNNFAVLFTSLSASDYSTVILPQSQSELRSISFEIQYKASLQNQRLTLSYSQSRRLQEVSSYNAPRLLPSMSFSTNVEVTAFPPANYIAADSYGFYDQASAAIFVLSLVLLFLNLIITPKKYALHSVSMAWLVPYLYFTVFYSTGYTTDWLSPMASNLKYIALYFGFSFGPCCSSDSILGTTSEVVSNSGAVIVVLLALWLVYLTLFLFTLKNKAEILAKALRMTKYLLVTLHAFFFFELIFASLNAFTKYVNNNKVDGANLFIALTVLIVTCCFLLYLWFVTYKNFQVNLRAASEKGSKAPSERKAFADVRPNLPNLDHDESNIAIKMNNTKNDISVVAPSIHALSVPETAIQEAAQEKPSLLFDFCTLYSANRFAKYFLPVLLSKVFLFALFSATLTTNPFAMLLLHLLLSIAFLVFVCAVRPFQSKLTQAKLIVIEVLLIALQLPFTIYQFYGMKSVYLQSVESYLIVEIIFLLLAAVFFTFAEQFVIWKGLLSELCANLGVQGVSRKVADDPTFALEVKKETIKIEEVLQKPVQKEPEEKSQKSKEADKVRFGNTTGFSRNLRVERTKTAAQKTSQEQFA